MVVSQSGHIGMDGSSVPAGPKANFRELRASLQQGLQSRLRDASATLEIDFFEFRTSLGQRNYSFIFGVTAVSQVKLQEWPIHKIFKTKFRIPMHRIILSLSISRQEDKLIDCLIDQQPLKRTLVSVGSTIDKVATPASQIKVERGRCLQGRGILGTRPQVLHLSRDLHTG